jgi:hypothetical protein
VVWDLGFKVLGLYDLTDYGFTVSRFEGLGV